MDLRMVFEGDRTREGDFVNSSPVPIVGVLGIAANRDAFFNHCARTYPTPRHGHLAAVYRWGHVIVVSTMDRRRQYQ